MITGVRLSGNAFIWLVKRPSTDAAPKDAMLAARVNMNAAIIRSIFLIAPPLIGSAISVIYELRIVPKP
jgi:hypothetical protein